jgi:micrococcal nuclease
VRGPSRSPGRTGLAPLRPLAVCAMLVALAAAGCAGNGAAGAEGAAEVTVAFVVDGDTIELENGEQVRLVQIDAPEAGDECYGLEAGEALHRLVPDGETVHLEGDPALDDTDRFGRLLRYVHRGGTNVNLALVERGAASVWFVDGDRGRYADELMQAARTAESQGQGAWGACEAELDPYHGFQTMRG